MTGRHFRWHRRWTVSLETASATHDSGLVVRFLALPLTDQSRAAHESESAIGKCWTTDGREWGAVTTPAILEATFATLRQRHGAGNAQKMIARLAREAGEVWAYAKNREH